VVWTSRPAATKCGLAEDILCPALQWPGQQAAARPYNLSLGTALADVPCIAAALDLLALTGGALAVDRAARLLRSRYLPGDDAAWLRRAAIEARWREAGRDEIDVAALTRTLAGAEAPLAQRWRAAYDASGGAGRAVPREWCQAWRRLLAGIGWPGERTPDSAEYQALGAWDDLLVTFATLDPVSGRLGRGDALAALRALAEKRCSSPNPRRRRPDRGAAGGRRPALRRAGSPGSRPTSGRRRHA
jgi:hypothetical protein